MTEEEFSGSKITLFHDDNVLTYQRDDFDHIPFPGLWDLPSDGRENNETPEDCVLQELQEEFDLTLDEARVVWKRRYESAHADGAASYFFVAYITIDEVNSFWKRGAELANGEGLIFHESGIGYTTSS